jgi:hypothetical protein
MLGGGYGSQRQQQQREPLAGLDFIQSSLRVPGQESSCHFLASLEGTNENPR